MKFPFQKSMYTLNNKKSLLCGAVLLAVTLAGCLESAVPLKGSHNKDPLTVNLQESFDLRLGQTATLQTENFSIRPSTILVDSRCPINVNCFWSGELEVSVQIIDPAVHDAPVVVEKTITISTLPIAEKSAFYKNYQIKLLNVEPQNLILEGLPNKEEIKKIFPKAYEKIPLEEYLFTFQIEKTASAIDTLTNNNPSSSMANASRHYTGSLYKDNYVYAAAMNLAWNEAVENIFHEKIKLDTQSTEALKTTELLNRAPFSKQDLDAESYYIKSGFGQKTVDMINKEVKEKFPEKTFADIKLNLADDDLLAYAYFLKKVEYLEPFSKSIIYFQNKPMKSFWPETPKQRRNIAVNKYWNEDQFIVNLKLKNSEDQLFIIKGFENSLPETVVNEMNQYSSMEEKDLTDDEVFNAPYLSFDHQRSYDEMVAQKMANKYFEDYVMSTMFENIKFEMDEKGARVENEAVFAAQRSSASSGPKPRRFVLDKPFWIIMKRRDSQNPYFILGVKNTEIMQENIAP